MEYPKNELFEKLAAIEHERWSDWMRCLFDDSFDMREDDGTPTGEVLIPARNAERWKRQVNTPYAELSQEEKDSDRKQVMRYWQLIDSQP
ncbi:MAG: hypothetical protein AB9866_18830 [Syntrophobacteraceae bacterium]